MLADDLYLAAQTEESIENKEYTRETLEGADISKVEFYNVRFIKCRFINCDFSSSAFYHTAMDTCDFSNCRFCSCYLKDATMTDCRGDGCNFSQSSFLSVTVEQGSYYYANFTNTLWKNSRIDGALLNHSYLPEVKFQKTALHQVNLTNTDFFKTSLKGLDLSTCCIEGITVSDTYRELQGVKINAAQAPDIALLLGVKFV